jgi:tetratricopeptide (TPR) repeat protein
MVVTLPVILLVLDYWPLRRLDSGRLSKVQSRKKTKSQEKRSLELGSFIFPFKPLVLEKVPLLILSFLVSGITILAQQCSGDLQSLHSLPLLNRLQNATVSAVCYLQKLVWPAGLAVIYPHPGAALPWWQVLGSILMLIAVTWGVFRQVRRRPYLAAGWLWFLISSLPIIGIIQVGAQAMADRYAYVPFIGLFIMIAWSLEDLVARFGLHREWFYATMLLPLIPCWSLTRIQLRYWPTSHKLFQHAVEVTSNNYVANRSLGTLLLEEGKVDKAIASIKKSLQANPSQDAIQSYHRGEALLALGGAYLQKGDPQAAEFWLR